MPCARGASSSPSGSASRASGWTSPSAGPTTTSTASPSSSTTPNASLGQPAIGTACLGHPGVLRATGWRVVHVLTKDWHERPERGHRGGRAGARDADGEQDAGWSSRSGRSSTARRPRPRRDRRRRGGHDARRRRPRPAVGRRRPAAATARDPDPRTSPATSRWPGKSVCFTGRACARSAACACRARTRSGSRPAAGMDVRHMVSARLDYLVLAHEDSQSTKAQRAAAARRAADRRAGVLADARRRRRWNEVVGRSPSSGGDRHEHFAPGSGVRHHVWATTRLIDACLDLGAEELKTSVQGTRGPMLETLRHLVLSDAFDLFVLTGDAAFDVDDEKMTLAEARVVMERNGSGWAEYVARSLDADEMVHEVGPDRRVPTLGTRRVQARGCPEPRHRPSESGLHGAHGTRRDAAADRCLRFRAGGGPDPGEAARRVALARMTLQRPRNVHALFLVVRP